MNCCPFGGKPLACKKINEKMLSVCLLMMSWGEAWAPWLTRLERLSTCRFARSLLSLLRRTSQDDECSVPAPSRTVATSTCSCQTIKM